MALLGRAAPSTRNQIINTWSKQIDFDRFAIAISYHCVEMVFRRDENAAIDRQTSGNANLSIIKDCLFTYI